LLCLTPSPITPSPHESAGVSVFDLLLLPPNPNVAYSACLCTVEEMTSPVRPYPVERTLLVSI
jgi:hypothetical protein